MNSSAIERLLAINREFYEKFGESFSATRRRIQPGARRVIETLNGGESILDVGCGNGELARVLDERGHRGSYLGLDFSLPLLRDAESSPKHFPARFVEIDLANELSLRAFFAQQSPVDLILAFAVLHHIPSFELRLNIVKQIRRALKPDGRFIHSNWQFLNSEKLRARIKDWDVAAVASSEVDAGDYLLDWRSGGEGLRYVHHFSEEELSALANAGGFQIVETFYSDGENGRLGLYQAWK